MCLGVWGHPHHTYSVRSKKQTKNKEQFKQKIRKTCHYIEKLKNIYSSSKASYKMYLQTIAKKHWLWNSLLCYNFLKCWKRNCHRYQCIFGFAKFSIVIIILVSATNLKDLETYNILTITIVSINSEQSSCAVHHM